MRYARELCVPVPCVAVLRCLLLDLPLRPCPLRLLNHQQCCCCCTLSHGDSRALATETRASSSGFMRSETSATAASGTPAQSVAAALLLRVQLLLLVFVCAGKGRRMYAR